MSEDERVAVKGRSIKKRKLFTATSGLESFLSKHDSDSETDGDEHTDDGPDEKGEEAEDEGAGSKESRPRKKQKQKQNVKITGLSVKELEQVNATKARTGVIYLSKIPPFMKPAKVRHLLSIYGDIGRIFLAPEDARSHAKRVRFRGNKRRMFTEGWVEFADKRKARLVVETLNANKIGGKKGGFYHDDLWNLKYLPKFKWDDLTAQIADEAASRQVRLRTEIEQAAREDKHFVKNVERNKMINNIKATRLSKRDQSHPNTNTNTNVNTITNMNLKEEAKERKTKEARDGTEEEKQMRRQFRQNAVQDKRKPIQDVRDGDKVTRVLSQIFA